MENGVTKRFYAVPVLGFALAFGFWSWLTFSDKLAPFDQGILTAFRVSGDVSTTVGPPWAATVVTGITHIGDSIFLIILCVGLIGWLAYRKKVAEALTLFGCAGGAFVMTPLLKIAFGRARPDIVDHLVHASSASFPSGHTLRSAVVYLAIFFVLRRLYGKGNLGKLMPAVALLAALIGASRVFLGVHWPSDIIAGWMIAGLWLSLWWPRLRSGVAET